MSTNSTCVIVSEVTAVPLNMGNLVSMFVYIYIYIYIFVHVSVYVFMRRHEYVYEYDCFMYVHMCTYWICMYVMTMYSAVRIPLGSNCAI